MFDVCVRLISISINTGPIIRNFLIKISLIDTALTLQIIPCRNTCYRLKFCQLFPATESYQVAGQNLLSASLYVLRRSHRSSTIRTALTYLRTFNEMLITVYKTKPLPSMY